MSDGFFAVRNNALQYHEIQVAILNKIQSAYACTGEFPCSVSYTFDQSLEVFFAGNGNTEPDKVHKFLFRCGC
jgi:hypothetical protein